MSVKIEYKFDPFELAGVEVDSIPRAKRADVIEAVGNYVLESVLSDVGGKKSPVTGEAFAPLSSKYKAIKKKKGGTPVANLELDGDMLNALKITKAKGSELKLYIPPGKQALKADNHNKFSAASKGTPVPARKFIPNDKEDETFRPQIIKGIKSIITDALEGNEE